jgi:uncharacterized protein
VHEAFFFGPDNRQLFASYHSPPSGSGRVFTVICPPLFSEFNRTQLTLRKLAIALSGAGQHVLRLDYRGTGDSFGDIGEVAISDWVEDITLAIAEGCELSGCSGVQLLAVRASALLACKAAGSVERVRKLVLWDPVVDGAEYLESLRQVQRVRIERNPYLGRAEYREAMHEHAGFRLSERMVAEFRRLDASTYSGVPMHKLHVVGTTPADDFPVTGAPRDEVQFACRWEQGTEEVIFAQPVLERLIACLT